MPFRRLSVPPRNPARDYRDARAAQRAYAQELMARRNGRPFAAVTSSVIKPPLRENQ